MRQPQTKAARDKGRLAEESKAIVALALRNGPIAGVEVLAWRRSVAPRKASNGSATIARDERGSRRRLVFDASILTDVDDVEAAVRELFMRAGNIADARKMQPPISVRLIDSEGQCLISRVLTEQGANPGAQPDKTLSSAAPTPWFLVLEDEQGKVAKVRLETGPQSIQ